MCKKILLTTLLHIIITAYLTIPAKAEETYVDIQEAEAVLNLMDEVATGQVTTHEQILEHLRKIVATRGYQIMCEYHGMNPRQNEIIQLIYDVTWCVSHDEVDKLKAKHQIFYDIYLNRDQYREFLARFQGWEPTAELLNRTYSYFPTNKPFTGTIYFVIDHLSDGYTQIPNMIFSIYQMKTMLDEKNVDFNLEVFPHEFHHILTKELLFKKYQNQLANSSDLSYLLGYIMLEGYAVQATAEDETKNEVYQMKKTDTEIYQLFANMEKVIQEKNLHSEEHWRNIYGQHFSSMIDIYTIGVTMVQRIEAKYGMDLTIKALSSPPIFFSLYQSASKDKENLYTFQESTMAIIANAFVK